MHIHIVNPSDVSFGTAVITPRWLYVLAAATPAHYGTPVIVDETLEPFDPGHRRNRATSSASASTPATRCAATRSAGSRASAARTVVFGGIHATLYPGRSARARRRRTRSSRATAISSGRRCSPTARPATPQPLYDGGRVEGDAFVAGALGSAAGRTSTCGARCRPCAAARSTARSARCGAPTARSRGSAASTASCAKSSQLRRRGFRFIAARRRQLLSGHARGPRAGRRAEPTRASSTKLEGDPRRSASS